MLRAGRLILPLDSLVEPRERIFMGLDLSAETYRGRLLAVKPVYGWGWSRLDAPEIPVPAQTNGVPHSFHCRIQHFFSFYGELRGAVGVIEEPGHIYDGLCVVFSTRVMGMHNFIDSLTYCDMHIGLGAPVGEWPAFVSGSPIVNGYGFVGESLKAIEENDARILGKTNNAL